MKTPREEIGTSHLNGAVTCGLHLAEDDAWLDQTCLNWLTDIPELYAVPELLAFFRHCDLYIARTSRRFLFRSVDAMENASLIPSRSVAAQCIALLFQGDRDAIIADWRPRLRERLGTYRLSGQMLGVSSNVRYNLEVRLMTPSSERDTSTKRRRPIPTVVKGDFHWTGQERAIVPHYRLFRQRREDGTCDIAATLLKFSEELKVGAQAASPN